MKTGRPNKISNALADKIFDAIANTYQGLTPLCKTNKDWPHAVTIRRKIANDEEFRNRYARAKEEQADLLADEIVNIADEVAKKRKKTSDDVNAAKLRIEARKWVAAKLKPKSYGEKVDVTSAGQKLPSLITQIEIVHTNKDEG